MTDIDHVNAWFEGKDILEIELEHDVNIEERLRAIARAHSIALGRALDDLNRLTIELALAAEAALELGQDETGEHYGHGLADGLARGSVAASAVRDALAQLLDKGPGAV